MSDHADGNFQQMLLKPASWFSRADFINHLILFNNVMMVIMAEQKGGKTSFLRMMSEALDPQIQCCSMSAKPGCTVADITQQLNNNLTCSKGELELADVVQQINLSKKHLLLIIDNAELLDDSCLQALLSQIKRQGDTGYFHVLLAADTTLCQRLQQYDSQGYKNLLHAMEVGTLTEEETLTYLSVNTSLTSQLGKPFTQEQMQSLFAATRGNIARINQTANSFCNNEKPVQSPVKRRASFAFVAGIAVIGLAVGYLQQHHDSLLQTFSDKYLAAHSQKLLDSDIAAVDFAHHAQSKVYQSTIAPFYVAATRQKVQPPPLTKVFASVFETEEDYTEGLGVVDKVLVIPKTLTKENPTAELTLVSQLVEIRFPKHTQPLDLGKAAGTLARGYTIQLIACRNKAETRQFLKKYPLAGESAYLRKSKRKGRDWYVLTLGEYTNFQQAKNAITQLPGDLSKLKPWIRPLSGLSKA